MIKYNELSNIQRSVINHLQNCCIDEIRIGENQILEYRSKGGEKIYSSDLMNQYWEIGKKLPTDWINIKEYIGGKQ